MNREERGQGIHNRDQVYIGEKTLRLLAFLFSSEKHGMLVGKRNEIEAVSARSGEERSSRFGSL